jgi:hypothetical protein
MIERIRRVVSGETDDGQALFTHVEEVVPLTMGANRWYGVWGWDVQPFFPYSFMEPYVPRSLFPDPAGHGARINVVEFAPGSGTVGGSDTNTFDPTDEQEFGRLTGAQPHGLAVDPETGMHATDSVDIGVVISGEICLEQYGGEEVTLRPGDIHVQNGATHAWRNRTDSPCTVVYILLPFGGRSTPRRLPPGVTAVDAPVEG